MNEAEYDAAKQAYDHALSMLLNGHMDPLDYQDAAYAYDVAVSDYLIANGHRPR